MKIEYLFDTNIVIDYLNGKDYAKTLIDERPHRSISIITMVEILCGIPESQEQVVHRWLYRHFNVISPDREVVIEAVNIRRQKLLKLPDTLILATARAYGLILCTRDGKDFSLYQNIEVVSSF